MAEENKHPPTTEEQAPPEMPGKAPEMEQAEIPDVGGGPTPSAKVIDLSAVRSTPEKDISPDIPKEPEAPPVSVTEYSKQEWESLNRRYLSDTAGSGLFDAYWHLIVTPLKMGAKKPGSRSISLYRDTNCHPSARERISPLPLPVLSVLCRELNDFAQRW